jgi:hypothetical protein
VLDLHQQFSHFPLMDFPALHSALAEHFGEDSEIESPEDESDAWKTIVAEYRDGGYQRLEQDLTRLLACSDQEVFEFLRGCAPAWECDGPANARHGLQVFQSYVETYSG